MAISETHQIECPRCNSTSCEESGAELFCPNCLYHEVTSSSLQSGTFASAPPSDAEVPCVWNQNEPETLGESIEQVPSELMKWNLSLGDERILRMTEHVQDENTNESFQKREFPPYELVAYPDEFKGTTWIKHGVAWPTKDGKRLKIKLFMDKPLPENGKLLLVESLKASLRTRTEEVPF